MESKTRRAGVFPMESNTETVAKRARMGPRTHVVSTMKKLFWIEISSTSVRLSDMIVWDHVLKIRMELIKCRDSCYGKSLSGANYFHMSKIRSKFRKFRKILKHGKTVRDALLLYELFAREPGWRFTARCHTETVAKRARVGQRTPVLSTMKKLFRREISSASWLRECNNCFR